MELYAGELYTACLNANLLFVMCGRFLKLIFLVVSWRVYRNIKVRSSGHELRRLRAM